MCLSREVYICLSREVYMCLFREVYIDFPGLSKITSPNIMVNKYGSGVIGMLFFF